MKARIAFMRFGLGPKPGGAARIGMNANSALNACLRELEAPAATLIPDSEIVLTANDVKKDVVFDYAAAARYGSLANKDLTPKPWEIREEEQRARLVKCMEPEVGYLERLVLFWTNHFSIYYNKSHQVNAVSGNFERVAIRPNVLGKFGDMLKAVMTHTGMVCYLDNDASYGPNSPNGKFLTRSYNENLAREILELHTVGVGAGYTQADVTNFAKILTGWTTYWGSHPKTGQFYFEPKSHEPGSFTVMGKTFAQTSQDQGFAVLDMLARHPATAQHIAFKMVRHFVMDDPPPSMVKALTRVFISTDGDLKAMAEALVRMPQSWSEPMRRITQPYPWFVSTLRGLGVSPSVIKDNNHRYASYLLFLDQAIWGRITPDGFPDQNYVWENPNAVRCRKDVINEALRVTPLAGIDPVTRARDLLPGLSAQVSAAVSASAADPREALTILFSSPEYLRR